MINWAILEIPNFLNFLKLCIWPKIKSLVQYLGAVGLQIYLPLYYSFPSLLQKLMKMAFGRNAFSRWLEKINA